MPGGTQVTQMSCPSFLLQQRKFQTWRRSVLTMWDKRTPYSLAVGTQNTATSQDSLLSSPSLSSSFFSHAGNRSAFELHACLAVASRTKEALPHHLWTVLLDWDGSLWVPSQLSWETSGRRIKWASDVSVKCFPRGYWVMGILIQWYLLWWIHGLR